MLQNNYCYWRFWFTIFSYRLVPRLHLCRSVNYVENAGEEQYDSSYREYDPPFVHRSLQKKKKKTIKMSTTIHNSIGITVLYICMRSNILLVELFINARRIVNVWNSVFPRCIHQFELVANIRYCRKKAKWTWINISWENDTIVVPGSITFRWLRCVV